jgi:hypothetical protein
VVVSVLRATFVDQQSHANFAGHHDWEDIGEERSPFRVGDKKRSERRARTCCAIGGHERIVKLVSAREVLHTCFFLLVTIQVVKSTNFSGHKILSSGIR